ncbi:MAG: flavocytochrome c [Burkholderiaceae bacterium]
MSVNDVTQTRRGFLKGAGATVAGAVVLNQILPTEVQAVQPPKRWDKTVEVLIIGSGFTGLTAAIEAHDAGAKVVIVEKNAFVGGNSIIASGVLNCADPERQKKQGIEDSTELHFKQTIAGGDFRGDPEKVRFLADNGLAGLQWLEKMGVAFEPTVYTVIGALWPRSHDPINKGRGGAIVKGLKAQVNARKIPIQLNTKLEAIVRQKTLDGPVMGAVVSEKGKRVHIKATRAVVIATGGFSADVPMRSKHDPRLGKEVPTTNVPSATGEAIVAAANEGADVSGMDYIQLLVACNYFTKKYGSLANLGIDSAIFINTEGKRFVHEDARRDVLAEGVLKQTNKVLLWIADENCKKRFGPEQTEKILADGLSFRANTLEELAKILEEKFKVPPATFLATVKQYNELAASGKDTDFGKAPTNLKPILKPPFYASPTQAGVHHTMGGLRTQGTTGKVLDREGKVIPRLYAGGEVTGGTHGSNRLGGNATTDCIVFGRAVGINAAGEKPLA